MIAPGLQVRLLLLMAAGQNFLKVIRIVVTFFFLFLFYVNYSFAENLKFKKIVDLEGP